MRSIKWGIIGCGDVTEVKSGPAFSKVSGSSLVAVMRRNAEKAADYAQRHKVPKWYSDADALINDPGVNAIYVATPPSTHAFYAKKALKAGKPVYMEKPMCHIVSECLEVNELSAQLNIPVLVAYYRRKMPGFEKVKALIKEGAIGEVRMATIQLFKHFDKVKGELPWRMDPEIAGGGHFYDLASHQIDLLNYFFGDVKTIHSVVANQSGDYQVEDALSVSMEYANGVVFNGSWCFNSAAINNIDRFVIYGTKGRIEFSTFDFVPVQLISETGTEEFDFPRPEHVQQGLIEHVVEALIHKKECVSTGQSAVKTNIILENIVSSYYKKP